eukprot:8650646-Pyramimonas_sp.AAC.1
MPSQVVPCRRPSQRRRSAAWLLGCRSLQTPRTRAVANLSVKQLALLKCRLLATVDAVISLRACTWQTVLPMNTVNFSEAVPGTPCERM